jgi:hypothetical protein
MADESRIGISEVLSRIERDIANLKEAVGLLGVKPCCVCGRFYLRSNPANLFTAGNDAVCYACLSGWWLDRCHSLDISDRESIEHNLMRWLIANHSARVYRELRDLPPEECQVVRLVVACHECKGSGRMGGDRCRHCGGNRNVWVVTLK